MSAIGRLLIHPAKFDSFKDETKQTKKLSQLHKEKTFWTENSFLSKFDYLIWTGIVTTQYL